MATQTAQSFSAQTQLESSLITSGSERSLVDLLVEAHTIAGLHNFDLYVLRDVDVRDIERGVNKQPASLAPPRTPGLIDKRTATELMAEDSSYELISQWLKRKLETAARHIAGKLHISALATYYPDLSARKPKFVESGRLGVQISVSVKALANTVLLALDLSPAYMNHPIIEIVCGTILDEEVCGQCRDSTRIYVSDRPSKFRLLFEALRQVATQVHAKRPGTRWYLALELEPGDTYVLNTAAALTSALNMLSDEYPDLLPYVGLNVDIAHMAIAGVPVSTLRARADRILHSHIADHPGMHSRDQPIGRWSSLHHFQSPYYEHLKLIAEQLPRVHPKPGMLPFSGVVALELEGCNRFCWICESIGGMDFMFNAIQV